MTEMEKQLLSALESLQTSYEQQQQAWQDSYSQQLASLKAKSGAGVTIYSDDSRRNTYLVVLPKQAHGVETYTSQAGNTVVKYTAK